MQPNEPSRQTLDQATLPTGFPVVAKRRSYGALPPEQRLGVGIVGLHEGHSMLVALTMATLCRPVVGCDLDPEKRAHAERTLPGLATTDRFEALLANPEVQIVAIYTPDPLHADQIEAAFWAGKHVVCTKPLINRPEDADRLRQAARETGRRLQVAQSTRFYEPFQRQRELFLRGTFGEVEMVDAHYHHRMDWWYAKSPWSITQTHWAYLGLSHPVDYIRWYLGPIAQVHAVGSRSALARQVGLPTPDILSVQFLSKEGKVGRVAGHYGFHELPRARALIEGFLMGSEGTSLARYPDLRHTYTGSDGIEIEEDFHHAMAGYYYRHELKGMHYGEFCNLIESFAAALLADEPNSPDLEEGLETVRVMGAIVQSLESGGVVRL